MEITEDIKEARDILQVILKAKKLLRMYPPNNPIYLKTLEESFSKFKQFLDYKDSFTINIRQNSILYDNEPIYSSSDKEDNLALFFFKDGLRELSFKRGLPRDELEEFLKILTYDFEREVFDEDIVTLLWERDFQYIQYVVDEAFLVEEEEENYEIVSEKKIKEKVTDVNDLLRAYADGFQEEEYKGIAIVPLTDKDLKMLVEEIERDSSDKMGKLVSILFEIIYQTVGKADIEDIFAFLRDSIKYCAEHGEISMILEILMKAKEAIEDPSLGEREKKYLEMLNYYLGSEEIIKLFAELFDSGVDIDEEIFSNIALFFEKNSIEPLVKYLGELKTIRARKIIIESLVLLGKKDIQAIAKGLNDERWYVVRNIIYILRKIADRRAVEYLLKTIRHNDLRVKKEVIKTLGELGGKEVIQSLRECLDDSDMQVRITAVKAFGNIGTETAKKILIDKMSEKSFRDKQFEEKKEFYETLARWKSEDIFEFLIKIMKSKSFFNRGKMFENKACAAYALGLIGNKNAISILEKFIDSGNKLLKDYANIALKKLANG